MPKSQPISPAEMRRASFIEFQPIPVNQYQKTVSEELVRYSGKDLLRILRDMEIIRAFEGMLNEIKLRGNYKGIEYNHRGPGSPVHWGRKPVRSARPTTWASTITFTAATAPTAKSWPKALVPSINSAIWP